MNKYLLLDVFCNLWWSYHRVLFCGISFSAAFMSPPSTHMHTCYFAHQHVAVHCHVLACEWHETPSILKQSALQALQASRAETAGEMWLQTASFGRLAPSPLLLPRQSIPGAGLLFITNFILPVGIRSISGLEAHPRWRQLLPGVSAQAPAGSSPS